MRISRSRMQFDITSPQLQSVDDTYLHDIKSFLKYGLNVFIYMLQLITCWHHQFIFRIMLVLQSFYPDNFTFCRVATPVLAAMVKLLFSNKQELIEKFNQFLPAKYKISLPLSRRRNVSLERATDFIEKIKVQINVINTW